MVVILTGLEHVLIVGIEVPLHLQGFTGLQSLEEVQQALAAAGIGKFRKAIDAEELSVAKVTMVSAVIKLFFTCGFNGQY